MNNDTFANLEEGMKKINPLLLTLTFFLMFVNWGLEAWKWKLLVSSLEKISFGVSLKSVFSGVTVSIFMPNRVGEFAGRIFFLEKANKIEATLKNFVGSAMQLFMTFSIGLVAMFYLLRLFDANWDLSENQFRVAIGCIIAAFIFLIVLFFINRSRNVFSPKIQSYLKAVFDINRKDLFVVFCLSFLRYCVFLFQYYLVIKAVGIRVEFDVAATLIAVTFFISSVVPSFAFTEVLTRGAVAVSLFWIIGASNSAVVASSLLVWIINLAIPALIGSAFIWKLKLFKQ